MYKLYYYKNDELICEKGDINFIDHMISILGGNNILDIIEF